MILFLLLKLFPLSIGILIDRQQWLSLNVVLEDLGCSTAPSSTTCPGGLEFAPLDKYDCASQPPISCDSFGNVVALKLEKQKLDGSLSSEIGRLLMLTSLSLAENSLRNSIPREFGALTMLLSIDLRANQLSSTLPSELFQLSLLTSLVRFCFRCFEVDFVLFRSLHQTFRFPHRSRLARINLWERFPRL